jgi:IMP dehydrogenase
MIQFIKERYAVDVIAGNVATSIGAYDLCRAGADGIRIGIGGGGQCRTREVTGHGCPTLQSVIDCYSICSKLDVPIIADGGIKKGADIVKSLACGASAVCLGSLLASSSATPGELICHSGKTYKEFYGMASKAAQEKFRGGLKDGICSEGNYELVEYKGDTKTIILDLMGAIRSGFTYSGASNIEELQRKATLMPISVLSAVESKY